MEPRVSFSQNFPTPRVVLLSIKIDPILKKKWFSHKRRWISNGYP
jgi:hypothetical protein